MIQNWILKRLDITLTIDIEIWFKDNAISLPKRHSVKYDRTDGQTDKRTGEWTDRLIINYTAPAERSL